MSELVNVEPWLPLVAALIPLVASFVVAPEAANGWRAFVAIAAAGVLAVLEAVQGGEVNVETLGVAFLTAVVVQLTAYQAVWRQLGVNERVAPKVGVGKPAA